MTVCFVAPELLVGLASVRRGEATSVVAALVPRLVCELDGIECLDAQLLN